MQKKMISEIVHRDIANLHLKDENGKALRYIEVRNGWLHRKRKPVRTARAERAKETAMFDDLPDLDSFLQELTSAYSNGGCQRAEGVRRCGRLSRPRLVRRRMSRRPRVHMSGIENSRPGEQHL
jgi:hypothetical protein